LLQRRCKILIIRKYLHIFILVLLDKNQGAVWTPCYLENNFNAF